MYEDILDRGIKRTIISFDPFLKRDDVKGLTDAQVGRRFGLETSTVKAMRLHQDVPFDTIQKICHALGCQPGDVLNATEVWTIPPTKKDPYFLHPLVKSPLFSTGISHISKNAPQNEPHFGLEVKAAVTLEIKSSG